MTRRRAVRPTNGRYTVGVRTFPSAHSALSYAQGRLMTGGVDTHSATIYVREAVSNGVVYRVERDEDGVVTTHVPSA